MRMSGGKTVENSTIPAILPSMRHGVWCISLLTPFFTTLYVLSVPVASMWRILACDSGLWNWKRFWPMMSPCEANVSRERRFMKRMVPSVSQIVTAHVRSSAQLKLFLSMALEFGLFCCGSAPGRLGFGSGRLRLRLRLWIARARAITELYSPYFVLLRFCSGSAPARLCFGFGFGSDRLGIDGYLVAGGGEKKRNRCKSPGGRCTDSVL